MDNSKLDAVILEAITLISNGKSSDQVLSYDVHKAVDKTPFGRHMCEIISINIKLEKPLN